jgi:hypothetical protein
MGVMEWLGFRGTPVPSSSSTDVVLGEVLSNYDLVEVVANEGNPFVIVAEKQLLGNINPQVFILFFIHTINYARRTNTRCEATAKVYGFTRY